MMRILITGANGFLGRSLTDYFSLKDYEVISLARESLDISSKSQVEEWFDNNSVDFVIHTAIKGGRRGQPDTFEQFVANVNMHNNLANISEKVEGIFNFGSGAEFDRKSNIFNAKEEDINHRYPKDFYGLAKSLITKDIVKRNTNIYNFRLFGCYGIKEADNRLIKSLIRGVKNQTTTIIDKDKKMDFFYVEDVCRAIEFYINNASGESLPKDVNLVYDKKYTLKEISDLVESNLGKKNDNLLINKSSSLHYTGDAELCKRTFPKNLFIGFEPGIIRMCEEL